jgi:glycosyltransferase involved in cell wall biosynthesis
MMAQEPRVKVSILTTTYNHERYIAQAVESVMAQRTAFDYEQVIGEDYSTDRTREIVLDLQRQHPDKIRLLLRERNIGRRANFIDTFHACRGQYIAILEGDDYWTSPQKLQRQVDLLDSHPDYALCFHPVTRYFEDEDREKPVFPARIKDRYHLIDLLEHNFVPTCSVMFRNHLFGDFPDWFWSVPAGDLPLHVLNAQHGDIGYLNEVMAVHRIHAGGVWSHRPAIERLRDRLDVQQSLRDHLGPQYAAKLDDTLATTHLRIIRALSLQHDYSGMVRHAWHLLFRSGLPLPSLLRATGRLLRGRLDAGEGALDS